MKRLVVKVAGRVQGVLFRHSARTHAEKLGLTGFVKNEPDGSVAIVAEGEDAALNEFLAWFPRRPPPRQGARSQAENLGPAGFEKNEPDGSVAIVAEGEDAALNEFLEWCRRGP